MEEPAAPTDEPRGRSRTEAGGKAVPLVFVDTNIYADYEVKRGIRLGGDPRRAL